MYIGDKVRVKTQDGRELTGKIIDSKPALDVHTVQFDDKALIPPEMEYYGWQLELRDSPSYLRASKCDCGAESAGYGDGFHVHWCSSRK